MEVTVHSLGFKLSTIFLVHLATTVSAEIDSPPIAELRRILLIVLSLLKCKAAYDVTVSEQGCS